MTPTGRPPAPIAPPTLDGVRRQLRATEGARADAIVDAACAAAGVPAADPLALDALARVAEALAAQSRSAELAARALAVRVRAHQLFGAIAARATPAAGHAGTPARPSPADEADRRALERPERLAEVARLGLHRPRADAFVDATLAALAGELGMESALLNVLLADAQVYHATHGVGGRVLEAGGSPAEWSACRRVVGTGAPVAVPDATRDALTAGSVFVTHEGLRAYAGAPLVSARGEAVGAVCVCGPETRTFGGPDVAALVRAAGAIAAHLERRAAADAAAAAAA